MKKLLDTLCECSYLEIEFTRFQGVLLKNFSIKCLNSSMNNSDFVHVCLEYILAAKSFVIENDKRLLRSARDLMIKQLLTLIAQ